MKILRGSKPIGTAATPRRVAARAGRTARRVYRLWFDLTPAEQRAVVLTATLFLCGLVVRWWFSHEGS